MYSVGQISTKQITYFSEEMVQMVRKYEIKKQSHEVFVTEFSSISALSNYCDNEKVNNNIFAIPNSQSSIAGNYDFTLTRTYDESNELLVGGWDSGAKQLTKRVMLGNLNLSEENKRITQHDVVGFQASVPRYLQGIPTNMVNRRNVKQKQRVIDLVKAITYPARVSADAILKDSAKFIQIIREIESKGVRVNAYTYFHSTINEEQIVVKVKIKSANERLNISKLSYPLMHPSFLRRQMFRVIEVEKRAKKTLWRAGYGSPPKDEEVNNLGVIGDNDIYIPTMVSDEKAIEIVSGIGK